MNELSLSPFPLIYSKNLYLRKLSLEDENDIFTLRSDPRVLEFLDRQQCKSVEEARQFILKINDGIDKNIWIYWGITDKVRDKLMGTICLWNFSKDKSRAEIGYELIPEYQGMGIVQEAITKVIAFAFNTLKLNSIEAYVHFMNLKSINVLTRNGFIRTVDLNEKTPDNKEIIYTLEQEDWRSSLNK